MKTTFLITFQYEAYVLESWSKRLKDGAHRALQCTIKILWVYPGYKLSKTYINFSSIVNCMGVYLVKNIYI